MSAPRKKHRDLSGLMIAIVLLCLCGGIWVWMSGDARERRDAVLAKVPDFPTPGQPDQHPRRADPGAPRRRAVRPQPPAPVAQKPPTKIDPMVAFAVAPGHSAALVHINALVNTPLYEKIKECVPQTIAEISKKAESIGFDFERDVDRVAFVDGGVAMSGYFEGKPIAQAIAKEWQHPDERSYRGATIYSSGRRALAQIGNTLVEGDAGSIESLIDRVIDPPPPAVDPGDVYGDVYWRTDLESIKENAARGGKPDAIDAVLASLKGVTMRANVWDSVALSLEGKPQDGSSPADLARMARGALSLVRDQLDQEDVELSALAELARVQADKSQLNVDLALPATDLFDKLRFPCPGRDGQGAPPRHTVVR